jgi:hypothetical protein
MEDINTGTWSFRLAVEHKADELDLKKKIVAKFIQVKIWLYEFSQKFLYIYIDKSDRIFWRRAWRGLMAVLAPVMAMINYKLCGGKWSKSTSRYYSNQDLLWETEGNHTICYSRQLDTEQRFESWAFASTNAAVIITSELKLHSQVTWNRIKAIITNHCVSEYVSMGMEKTYRICCCYG